MESRNGIHIIDCAKITKPLKDIQDTKEFKIFAEQFGTAMKLNGIAYLINTEVQNDVISNLEQKLAEFYSLPFDVKKKYHRDVFGISKHLSNGWKGPTEESLKRGQSTEFFDFIFNNQLDLMYPEEVNGFKETVVAFRKQTMDLSAKLLRSLGECLDLEDKDFFTRVHRAVEENYEIPSFSVRTLFYPKEPEIRENAVKFRLPEHQDLNTLSQLCQNSQGGGLQAQLHTGKWVDVEYIPNSFVVNAGRALEMWSGGNIPAVLHRVVWTERSKAESRISFGCFTVPLKDVCCLPQVKENPNWTPMYEKMQPGERYDDYKTRQVRILEEKSRAQNRR